MVIPPYLREELGAIYEKLQLEHQRQLIQEQLLTLIGPSFWYMIIWYRPIEARVDRYTY